MEFLPLLCVIMYLSLLLFALCYFGARSSAISVSTGNETLSGTEIILLCLCNILDSVHRLCDVENRKTKSRVRVGLSSGHRVIHLLTSSDCCIISVW